MKAQYFDPHYRHKKVKNIKKLTSFKNFVQHLLTKWWKLNTCKANAKTTKHALYYLKNRITFVLHMLDSSIQFNSHMDITERDNFYNWVTYNRTGPGHLEPIQHHVYLWLPPCTDNIAPKVFRRRRLQLVLGRILHLACSSLEDKFFSEWPDSPVTL